MSYLYVHEDQCRKLLGKPFTAVHEFLDQHYLPLDNPSEAHLHRKHLHHWGGVKKARQMFGRYGSQAAIIHILEDCLGYIPKPNDYKDGKVDDYGCPIDSAKMDTHWFEHVQKRQKAHPL